MVKDVSTEVCQGYLSEHPPPPAGAAPCPALPCPTSAAIDCRQPHGPADPPDRPGGPHQDAARVTRAATARGHSPRRQAGLLCVVYGFGAGVRPNLGGGLSAAPLDLARRPPTAGNDRTFSPGQCSAQGQGGGGGGGAAAEGCQTGGRPRGEGHGPTAL